ncbi:GNAT family N-acetyltransferase [Streptomyces sp. NPDC008150]|uniref:GNAT family N-acetyltransferase n=1 Tax=Streptomyces sp. NPDC008150 TaxID=3364816 RepID=UPI0036E02617
MHLRLAGPEDVPVLAALNEQLIVDQGHENPMRGRELADRMQGWLAGEYTAALGILDGAPACYALWRPAEGGGIHLRQFFVAREFRRRGVGRRAIAALRDAYWPGRVIMLDVLVGNHRGAAFWHSLGFEAHTVAMRSPAPRPERAGAGDPSLSGTAER